MMIGRNKLLKMITRILNLKHILEIRTMSREKN